MPNHWTEIGRLLAAHLRGLDTKGRVAHVRQDASRLGLAPHTLRRYVVLADFLEQVGIGQDEARHLPIAPLEVVLRIRTLDPPSAMKALHAMRAGTLTLRAAVAMEKRLRARVVSQSENSQPPARPDAQDPIPQAVGDLCGCRIGELLDVERSDDLRWRLAGPDRLWMRGETTIAYLDEGLLSYADGFGTVALARRAIVAAAVFDHVVLGVAFEHVKPSLEEVLAAAHPGHVANIKLLRLADLAIVDVDLAHERQNAPER